MAQEKIEINFKEISDAIHQFDFPKVDIVIGIATGGIYPAIMIAHQLKKDFHFIHINFRDIDNQPKYEKPKLISGLPFGLPRNSRILLVDEVSVSGKTMSKAKELFTGMDIKTFVLKGNADYVLFKDIPSCVIWPWKIYEL